MLLNLGWQKFAGYDIIISSTILSGVDQKRISLWSAIFRQYKTNDYFSDYGVHCVRSCQIICWPDISRNKGGFFSLSIFHFCLFLFLWCFSSRKGNGILAHTAYVFVPPCVPVSPGYGPGCFYSPAMAVWCFYWAFILMGIKEVPKFWCCETLIKTYELLRQQEYFKPADKPCQHVFQIHPVNYSYLWWVLLSVIHLRVLTLLHS